MNLIAAADRNWGIGKDNNLLVRIPEDMKFFRTMTEGNVVIMGRKTLESFPNAKPLPNRTNIVLTNNAKYQAKGAVVVHSVEEAIEAAKETHPDDIFVIGGETVYRQFLPYCDTAYITKIDFAYEADAFFPNLDESPEWELTEESEEETYFNLEYIFTKYKKKI